jgi:hypothetical protein
VAPLSSDEEEEEEGEDGRRGLKGGGRVAGDSDGGMSMNDVTSQGADVFELLQVWVGVRVCVCLCMCIWTRMWVWIGVFVEESMHVRL